MKRQWLAYFLLILIMGAVAGCVPVRTLPVSTPALEDNAGAVVDSHLHYLDFTQQSEGFPALVAGGNALRLLGED